MARFTLAATCLAVGFASIALYSQTRPATGGAVVYEGARLIIGDATAPIENGAFVVQNGRFTAVGRRGAVPVPAGATRVDLTGKTVMPAIVNVHAHFGYEKFTKAAGESLAENFTPENLLDHLQRDRSPLSGGEMAVGPQQRRIAGALDRLTLVVEILDLGLGRHRRRLRLRESGSARLRQIPESEHRYRMADCADFLVDLEATLQLCLVICAKWAGKGPLQSRRSLLFFAHRG